MIKHQMDDECSLLSAPIWLMTVGTQHYHFEQNGFRARVHSGTRGRGEGAPIKRKKKVGEMEKMRPLGFELDTQNHVPPCMVVLTSRL